MVEKPEPSDSLVQVQQELDQFLKENLTASERLIMLKNLQIQIQKELKLSVETKNITPKLKGPLR